MLKGEMNPTHGLTNIQTSFDILRFSVQYSIFTKE
jgi:hypothetical protein